MKKYFVLLLILLLISCQQRIEEKTVIRKAAVAGSWYPGTKSEIMATIDDYFNNTETEAIDGNIKALIVPHAGWSFSGLVAASGFELLEGKNYKTVIVIGPSHRAAFSGASIPNATHYETPLGLIKLSEKRKILLKEPNFISYPIAHKEEHCIEIELPFLQKTLGEFELIPIIIGYNTNYEQLSQIADSIKGIMDESTLIVISSDFTHFGYNYGYIPFTENIEENIKNLDNGAISFIINKDPSGFYDYVTRTGATICGRLAITILLNIFKDSDITVKHIIYDTSGRQLNDFKNSVSYVSLVFYNQDLSRENKEFLLRLARETLESYVKKGKKPQLNADLVNDRLLKVQGCFVTLNKNGNLRGCIGHILPQEELYKCVIDNAVNAAAYDKRFSPVKPDELDEIEVEVSVLTVPEELYFESPDDLLNKLQPNIDGVVLQYEGRQSTYLPQVWEQLPNKELFLSSLCQKQGSPADCWQQPYVKVYTYNAFVFHEE